LLFFLFPCSKFLSSSFFHQFLFFVFFLLFLVSSSNDCQCLRKDSPKTVSRNQTTANKCFTCPCLHINIKDKRPSGNRPPRLPLFLRSEASRLDH
jgi:hypothetical protein